jgi:ketosteroid isomerase-like protein
MTSNAFRAASLTQALHAGVRGDRDALAAVYTDDVTAWTPAHSVSSLAGLLAELERRDDAFSDIELEVTPLDAGGEFACAEWRVTMVHTGTLRLRDGALIEPTGLQVSLNGVTVAEFRGERICSLRQYWDELAVFEQLGLLDAEDEAAQGALRTE